MCVLARGNEQWDTGQNLGRSIGSCEQATQSGTGSTISEQEATSGKDWRFREPSFGANDMVGGSCLAMARSMKPSFWNGRLLHGNQVD
jgi:hypothetical protein